MMPSPAVEFDMAVRSVVTIDAPPAEVWSGLARLQDWKPSVVSVERLGSAAEGEEGETLRIGQRPGDSTVYVIMRTIRSLPDEWKLQTLRTEDGDATDGYVSYSLIAEQEGTRLCCAAIARCRAPLPPGVGSGRDLERIVNVSTLEKLEADLARLKQLVEHGRKR